MKRRRTTNQPAGISCHRPWLLLVLTAVAVGAGAGAPPSSTVVQSTDVHVRPHRPAMSPLRALVRCQRKHQSISRVDRGTILSRFRGGGGGGDSTDDKPPPASSADVSDGRQPPAESDTSTSCETTDGTDNISAEDDASDDELKNMAYSLSGITRKVDNSDHSDDDSSSAVPNESPIESDTLSKDEDGDATVPTDTEEAAETEAETEAETAIVDGPSSPLSDLSNRLHEILIRHRMHSEEENKEVTKLRDLTLERCEEYIDDIQLHDVGESKKKPRHPRKLLHFLAPKIPAIKQSPDITLRIKSAKADLDGSAAAYAIGSIACMTELYDQHASLIESQAPKDEQENSYDGDEEEDDKEKSEALAYVEIISDRRLEQLVECVLSSVDAESITKKLDRKDDSDRVDDDISASISADSSNGLSVQDTAYAAFGLALLGARDMRKLGGYKPREVFSVLSLHCRDMLLAKQNHFTKQMKDGDSAKENLDNIIRDVASSLWAFSCVKSICGYRSDDLFDTCCSILLLQETALKRSISQANETLVSSDEERDNVSEGNKTVDSKSMTNTTDTADFVLPMTTQNTLLGHLGQRELINSLWALALHGSSDNKALHWGSEDDDKNGGSSHATSESSEILADLLLERVGYLLGEEIGRLAGDDDAEEKKDESSSSGVDGDQNGNAEHQFDPDADARDQIKDNEVDSPSIDGVQEMLCDNNVGDGAPGDGEVIQVISAAAILEEEAKQRQDDTVASNEKKKPNEKNNDGHEEINVAEKVDSGIKEREEELAEDRTDINDSNVEAPKEKIPAPESTSDNAISLSINDMCSIAWAATELGCEASVDIVWRITILFCYSREDVTTLGGTALSNLAWAIAKNLEVSNGSKLKRHIETIVEWIAESSLEILAKQPRYLSKTATGKCFQPPELSRLLWSLSLIQSAATGILSGGIDTASRNPVLAALAAEAMRITSYDLPVFSVEDLARILWAFTELGNTSSEVDILSGSTVQSFGRIQETIEASLLRWESGQKNVTASHQHKEGGLFSRFPSTFFGKARSRRLSSLLDLKISDDDDEDDDASTSKPTLKDLTVDPATLSKLCFGLAQVSRNHQQIVGSEQILRVASRLFSSKNGRLLSECSHKDVIRMCCACVDTMKLAGKELRGSDREFVLRQFPRRVVQLINTPLSDGRSYLDDLSPEDVSAMLFALGELGIRSSRGTESPETEHRRLRIVPPCPVLSEEMLDSLSLTSVANLVSGIIAIGDTSPGSDALENAMKNLEQRIDTFGPGDTYLLCRLTVALSRLLRAPASAPSSNNVKDKKMKPTNDEEAKEADDSAENEEQVIENLSPTSLMGDDESPSDSAIAKRDQEEIRKRARDLLGLVLEQAAARIDDMSGEQIRRILLHVVLLPYQADEFVEAAETEVHKRLSALDADAATASFGSLEELSQQTADAAVDIATSLSTSSSGAGDNPFKFLKKGGKGKDLAAEANRAAASACEAAARLDRIHRGAHLKGEEILHQIEQGAAFELGRCLTLLERYRRIEFADDSFSRQSRYDDERRKIIGKRVCSRLFS